jgi:hypothetical protein
VAKPTRVVGLAATVVTLLLLGAGPATLDAKPKPKPTIKFYPYGPKRPTKVGGVFTNCNVDYFANALDIHSGTADDEWDVQIQLRPWKGVKKGGLKKTYILYYGKSRPGAVRLSSAAGTFTTASPPPPGIAVHPAGKIAFSPDGSELIVATTTWNGPYTKEVYIEGALKCVIPR